MQAENLNILIVDDHMIMRNLVQGVANNLGLRQFKTASDGQDALDKIKQEKFDIILADWNMPKLSGEELLKILRSDSTYDKTAFVMITAESENVKKLEILSLGATAYLNKPFSEESFRETIEKVLAWLEKKHA